MNTTTEKDTLVITRSFKASKATLWKMLTQAEHLAYWWGPVGYEMEVFKMELRPGGVFHYNMKSPGHAMMGLFIYREISEPDKMVFVNGFADTEGNLIRAPFYDGKWPLEVLTEITLESKGAETQLTLRSKPINCTPEETALFFENIPSMGQGFKGAMDKLEILLQKNA